VFPRPLVKLGNGEGNLLGLLMPLQLIKADLILDDLTEQECEEFLVVLRLSEVFAETLCKRK
jgi:hypothetical protein